MKRALLIAAMVGLVACTSQPTAAQSPSPQPASDYGAPPAGVPLFYVGDPNHSGWYIGLDWNGGPRATVKLKQPLNDTQKLIQAPDGSGFVVPGFKGEGGEYLDRLGRPTGTAPATLRIAWGDDSRHLCTLDDKAGTWQLGVVAPDGTTQSVNSVALDSPNLGSGIVAIDLAACSIANDRAVLAYAYAGRPSEFWVVQLSTGKILSHRNDGDGVSTIVASRDGTLIAENSSKSSGYLMTVPAGFTTIRGSIDGSLVARLPATMGVLAFSADDSIALVSTTPWAAGIASNVALVKVSTATSYWQAGGDELSAFLVQPAGKGFALFFKSVGDATSPASIKIDLIGAGHDGYLPTSYLQP